MQWECEIGCHEGGLPFSFLLSPYLISNFGCAGCACRLHKSGRQTIRIWRNKTDEHRKHIMAKNILNSTDWLAGWLRANEWTQAKRNWEMSLGDQHNCVGAEYSYRISTILYTVSLYCNSYWTSFYLIQIISVNVWARVTTSEEAAGSLTNYDYVDCRSRLNRRNWNIGL